MLRNPGLRKSVEQPVLDLNFAASQIGSNAAPDSRIDFSRGSNAWFVDSDGLVKKSPHNLSLYSEDFTQWNANAGVVTANQIAAPDGSLTADLLADNGTTGNHRFSRLINGNTIGETMFASIYVKATSDNTNILWREDKEDGLFVGFNPTTGQITSGTGTAEDVGNGWYRLTITGALASQTVWSPEIRFIGTPASVYVWGAQLSQHYVLPVDNPYLKTTGSAVYAARLDHDPTWFMSAAQEQNLFQYSEVLADATYWTATRIAGVSNTTDTTAPDGTNTAERFLEFVNNSTHFFHNDLDETPFITKGKSYTYSAYVKRVAGSNNRNINIELFTTNQAFSPYSVASFDLDAVSSTASTGSPDGHSITDEGNGWFRISITEAANKTALPAIALVFTEGTTRIYAGDTSKGFYVWGIQLEVGTSPGTYYRTEGQPYYGEGATPKGMLIEEARTNLVTDSESHTYIDTDVNVTQSGSAGLAPDGTNTAIAFMETAATGDHVSRKSVTIADNQNIIFSFFVKANGRTDGQVEFFNAGGGYANFDLTAGTIDSASVYSSATNGSTSIEDYGNGWFRVSFGLTTVSGDTSATIQIRVHDSAKNNSYAGDTSKGLLIWGLQLEQGSFPTSYIKTTGSTATRNADVAVMGPTTGGTELVTNGTFDAATDWTFNEASTTSITGGKLVFASATQSKAARQDDNTKFVVGRRYRASFDITSYTAGSVKFKYLEGSGFTLIAESSNANAVGSYTVDFTCSNASVNRVAIQTTGTTNTFEIDNVSVRELYPFEQFNNTDGTFVVDAAGLDVPNQTVMQVDQGAVNTAPYLRCSFGDGASARIFSIISSSVANSYDGSGGVDTAAENRVAFAYGTDPSDGVADKIQTATNGTVHTEGTTDAAIGGFERVLLGGGAFFSDPAAAIKRIRYFNRRLLTQELKAITDD